MIIVLLFFVSLYQGMQNPVLTEGTILPIVKEEKVSPILKEETTLSVLKENTVVTPSLFPAVTENSSFLPNKTWRLIYQDWFYNLTELWTAARENYIIVNYSENFHVFVGYFKEKVLRVIQWLYEIPVEAFAVVVHGLYIIICCLCYRMLFCIKRDNKKYNSSIRQLCEKLQIAHGLYELTKDIDIKNLGATISEHDKLQIHLEEIRQDLELTRNRVKKLDKFFQNQLDIEETQVNMKKIEQQKKKLQLLDEDEEKFSEYDLVTLLSRDLN